MPKYKVSQSSGTKRLIMPENAKVLREAGTPFWMAEIFTTQDGNPYGSFIYKLIFNFTTVIPTISAMVAEREAEESLKRAEDPEHKSDPTWPTFHQYLGVGGIPDFRGRIDTELERLREVIPQTFEETQYFIGPNTRGYVNLDVKRESESKVKNLTGEDKPSVTVSMDIHIHSLTGETRIVTDFPAPYLLSAYCSGAIPSSMEELRGLVDVVASKPGISESVDTGGVGCITLPALTPPLDRMLRAGEPPAPAAAYGAARGGFYGGRGRGRGHPGGQTSETDAAARSLDWTRVATPPGPGRTD